MIAPARATDEPAHLPSLQDYVAQNKDFLVGTAGAVGIMAGSYNAYLQLEQDRRQADEAFRASDEYNIQTAVQDFLQPYVISDPEEQVVKRDVMEAINELVRTWSRRTKKDNNHHRPLSGMRQLSAQHACSVGSARALRTPPSGQDTQMSKRQQHNCDA